MTIDIEINELLIIKKALMKAPFEDVYRLIPKLEQQASAQLQEPVKAKKEGE